MDFLTWAFGKNFLKNKPREPVIWRKTMDLFVASDKIWVLKRKSEF